MLPAIDIDETAIPLPPGECDHTGCDAQARYAFGNVYLCEGCLIDHCEAGEIPAAAKLRRVGIQ